MLFACGDPAAAPSSGADGGSPSAAAPPGTTPDAATPVADAGAAGSGAADSGPDAGSLVPPGQVAGLVGVGYGGLRVLSRDGGATWNQAKAETDGGGDDYELLRAVAWSHGTWMAVGWSVTTSTDGVTWTPLSRINEDGGTRWEGAESCGLVEALTADDQYFYAACASGDDPHHAFRSADGLQWTDVGTIGAVGGHPSIAHRAGAFYAYGDPKTSFRSSDAITWTEDPLQEATFCEGTWKSLADCHDASWWGGAYFRSEWQSKVTRSTTGSDFVVVHDDPSNNTLYRPRAMAAGWVAP